MIELSGRVRPRRDIGALTDAELVERAGRGDEASIRAIIQRHNQRLFRAARAVVRDDGEAEDVVQSGYVKAFTHLSSFRGEAELATWLTRIVLNEALGRLRNRKPSMGLEQIDRERTSAQIMQFLPLADDPETETSRTEVRHFLEQAIDRLPTHFRTVFILRDVQGLSVEETAGYLALSSQTVRTRLHRARKLLRSKIETELKGAFASLFPFDGFRCVRMADRVVGRLSIVQAGRRQ